MIYEVGNLIYRKKHFMEKNNAESKRHILPSQKRPLLY